MKAIWFGRHLYEPLLYLDSSIVEISPAPLNKGERLFVEDLKPSTTATYKFCTKSTESEGWRKAAGENEFRVSVGTPQSGGLCAKP